MPWKSTDGMQNKKKIKLGYIAILQKPLCHPLYGLYKAIHGMLSWAPSKRVISYPLAWRFWPKVILVGSKIGNVTGVF